MEYLTSAKKLGTAQKRWFILGIVLLAIGVCPLVEICGVGGVSADTSDIIIVTGNPDMGWPMPPTNFTVTESGNSVVITWTKDIAADTTIIRVKSTGYPTSVMDGDAVYDGVGTTVTLGGLSLGTEPYYFSAWSHNTHGYSIDYATGRAGAEKSNKAFLSTIVFIILGFTMVFVAGRFIWTEEVDIVTIIGILIVLAVVIFVIRTLLF